MKQQNRIMLETACAIAKKTRSKGVLLYRDIIEDYEALAAIGQEKKVDLILAIKDEASFQEAASAFKKVLRIPDGPLGSNEPNEDGNHSGPLKGSGYERR